MEARARAAVAKLQEVSQQVSSSSPTGTSTSTSDEDAETISRTLVLAQRTADNTVAQANADAESITVKARVDATTVIDNARSMADKLLDEARVEGRRSAESERIKAENEVQALLARRDFLLSDVDHLEHHLGAQRERIRDAAVSLQDLIERRARGSRRDATAAVVRVSGIAASAAPPPEASPGQCSGRAPAEQQDDVDDFADDATAAYDMSQDDESESEKYEFPSLMDATPAQMAGTESNADDENVAMRLDLGSLDVDAATRPSWSQAGDDPLIIGGDELQ